MRSPEAVAFCLVAAVTLQDQMPIGQAEYKLKSTQVYANWLDNNRASEHPMEVGLLSFNDSTTWPFVAKAIKEAGL